MLISFKMRMGKLLATKNPLGLRLRVWSIGTDGQYRKMMPETPRRCKRTESLALMSGVSYPYAMKAPLTTIKELIEAAGGPARVAKTIGKTSQAVSQWTRVPDENVMGIYRLCDGKYTPHQIRPDIFVDPEYAPPLNADWWPDGLETSDVKRNTEELRNNGG